MVVTPKTGRNRQTVCSPQIGLCRALSHACVQLVRSSSWRPSSRWPVALSMTWRAARHDVPRGICFASCKASALVSCMSVPSCSRPDVTTRAANGPGRRTDRSHHQGEHCGIRHGARDKQRARSRQFLFVRLVIYVRWCPFRSSSDARCRRNRDGA